MKKWILCILCSLISLSVYCDVFVHGYHRKDGTYVRPHDRSNPDSHFNNNWSTKGNRNPYTGEWGTKSRRENNNQTLANSYNLKAVQPAMDRGEITFIDRIADDSFDFSGE